MADNIQITAGTGTTILTDDCTTGHAQIVKLAISTDGSATLLPGDATDGLLVNLGANNDVVVSATNLDIRDLTSTDVITVTGGAGQTADVKVTLDSEAVALAAGTNNIGDVDVLSVVPGTGASNLGKAEDAAHADGDVGVMMLGVVNNTPSANTGDYATLSIGTNGGLMIAGCTAHDAVDAGSPAKIGAKAIAHGANPTAVAAADRTDLYANRHGVLFTIGGHPNIITRTVHIADADGAQTDASIVGTIAAGTKVAVTSIAVTLDSATTATGGVAVKIGFGATTIPADAVAGANGILLDHPGIAAGSGMVLGNGSGILGIGADGEELRLTCEDPTGGNLVVTFSYFTIES